MRISSTSTSYVYFEREEEESEETKLQEVQQRLAARKRVWFVDVIGMQLLKLHIFFENYSQQTTHCLSIIFTNLCSF